MHIYNLLSLSSGLSMYMSLELTTLDWIASQGALEKMDAPPLISHCQPVTPHLEAGVCDISPVHTGMSAAVVIMQILLRWPYCGDFMGSALLSCLEDTIQQQISWSTGSHNFSSLFHDVP